MKSLKTIFSIAKLSAREWLRLKFFHIIVFFGLLFIGFSHLLSSLTYSVQERLLYDFGLAGLELGLVLVATLIGSHAIHREIDRKTMFVLLARPIPRSGIVLGAWSAILILSLLFTIGFLTSFVMTSFGELKLSGLILSAFISVLKSLVIAAVAIAFGVMVRPMLALVASVSYWILSYSILDIEFFVKKMNNEAANHLVRSLKYFVPEFYAYNWKSHFYVLNLPTSQEVMWGVLHNLAWICVWLLAACAVFRRKEIA